jgi:thiamine kinase-like enzyme
MYCEKALREYLTEEIFPQLSPPPYGKIKMMPLASEKPVFLFIEMEKHLSVVGKSFKYGSIPLDDAWLSANKEYTNLKFVRDKVGMKNDSFEIISPLGEKKEFSALLVTRKASGYLLDHYINRAIYEQRGQKLFQKLGYLAKFFARLHGNSRTETMISAELPQWYLNKILKSLRCELLDTNEVKAIEDRASRWWNRKNAFGQDVQVIVHGDATPTNFFFYRQNVTGIDLERMMYADRCWDLGFVAAELKHHFLWRTGDKWSAEPFIGHFLWEYALNTGDTGLFYTITSKLPLYIALGLMRMTRNAWLGEDYRKILVEEARLCLEYEQ